MAYLDAGTGSLLVTLIALVFVIFFGGGWIMNILGAIGASKNGPKGRTRLVFHIIAAVIYPIGSVLGWIWLFWWRRTDGTRDTGN
jgi:hypothetical protein